MNKTQPNQAVTIPIAAQALKRNRVTIMRWCNNGFIKAEKRLGPGRTQPWLIPKDEVRRLGGVL